MKRIVLTGPESSGKTTLAQRLAAEFDTVWVPEYARTYLALKNTSCSLQDLVNIGIGQIALAESLQESVTDRPCIFIDTWLLEIRIWAEERFGDFPQPLLQLAQEYPPDLYLLCTPDLTWEPDPLRENPHDRDRLFLLYQEAAQASGVPVLTVSGEGSRREEIAIDAVSSFLQVNS